MMPPHMRGVPQFQQQFQRVGQQQQQQQQQPAAMQDLMIKQDEHLARKLQAHYDHRAQHPSYVAGHGGGGGGSGSGALQQMMGHGGHGGGGVGGDPQREARHKARDDQLKMALEANPEAFVSVPMLYVQCLLNNVPVKAFVDTGAQMTVMTVQCAKACGLIELIDSRFRGVASGVGAARIVGRVHMAQVGRAALLLLAIRTRWPPVLVDAFSAICRP